ncbi:MAG TPA: threonine/serine dehydratase [Chloroflexota bacterium]|nr:threonine/serine dehydratase [Chloroflexota bacterium]
MPGLAEVRAAADRIRRYVVRTPLERSARLSEQCQRDVWLKLECFQRTGSFKLRGALNAVLLLSQDERKHGVVTASAGNHGLGVARAAAQTGVAATVVVPETASMAKIAALRGSGAELLLRGSTYDDAEAAARQLSRERQLVYVSAYNDPAVVAGGGTIALEILEDLPSARTLIVPAGGGGLIGGVGIAAHGLDPEITIYGVQSEASPALHAAHQAGRRVEVEVKDSLADGLAGNVEEGSITFDLLRQHVRAVAVVTEQAIADAMRWLLREEHVLVEGSAAVGVAAFQTGALQASANGPVVLVLTGRNVAASVLQQYVFDS